MTSELRRGAMLALGFGLAKAVTSNAYITAFGSDARSSMGFVSSTTFVLVTNVLSALVALAVVVFGVRAGAAAACRVRRLPSGALVACWALALGYVLGAAGVFVALPRLAGAFGDAALYAVGVVLLTVAWVRPFVGEVDVRFAMRWLIAGYLVQAAAFFGLSQLGGWALSGACVALLACSLALLAVAGGGGAAACERAGDAGSAGDARHALACALKSLVSPLACVFILTTVVGLLHTSVIGGTLESVVGAVPMAEALVLATVLVALVVLVGSRVPDTSAVYRALFPLMLVALSLLPFVSEALGSLSGMVMVVCYDVVGIAFVLLLVETARAHPRASSDALVGVYLAGTQLFLVAGLALGLALNHLGADAPAASYVTVLMLACIYLLALVLMVLLRRRRASAGAADAGAREEVGRDELFGRRGFADGPRSGGAAAARVDASGAAPGADAAAAAGAHAEERAEQQEVRGRVGLRVEEFARARGLTPREAQVLVQLARGRSAAALAADLGIAENTAWAHIKRVYAKLGVHGKQELIDLVEREVIA